MRAVRSTGALDWSLTKRSSSFAVRVTCALAMFLAMTSMRTRSAAMPAEAVRIEVKSFCSGFMDQRPSWMAIWTSEWRLSSICAYSW